MNKRGTLSITILAVIAIVAIVVIVFFTGSITGAAISDKNCYKVASNKANTAAKLADELMGSGTTKNPCTGETDTWKTYYDTQTWMHSSRLRMAPMMLACWKESSPPSASPHY